MNASLTTRIIITAVSVVFGWSAFEHVQTGMETQLGGVSSCIDGLGTSSQSAACTQVG